MSTLNFPERYGILSDEVSPDLEVAGKWVRAQGLWAIELRSIWGVNAVKLDV